MNEQERAPIHSMTGFGHAAIERQGFAARSRVEIG